MNTNETQHTIIQYLKKLIGGGDKDNSILSDINKNISNIKINAESVNLNTDEVENKIQSLIYILSHYTIGPDDVIEDSFTNILHNFYSDSMSKLIILSDQIYSFENKFDNRINKNISDITTLLDSIFMNVLTIENCNETLTTINNKLLSLDIQNGYKNPKTVVAVPEGDCTYDGVVLCNITDETIKLTVRPLNSTSEIEVPIYPGWNPIVITQIKNATANTLLAGY